MKALTIPGAADVISALQHEIHGSGYARYIHRLHALLLVAQGMSCRQAAKLLGDSPRAVNYWVHRFEERGLAGLANNERPGRPRRLNEAQLEDVAQAIRASPLDYGFSVNSWDGKVLSAFIKHRFGVNLGVRQCQNLLKKLGFRRCEPCPKTLDAKRASQE